MKHHNRHFVLETHGHGYLDLSLPGSAMYLHEANLRFGDEFEMSANLLTHTLAGAR
jgi:hypothetical protein